VQSGCTANPLRLPKASGDCWVARASDALTPELVHTGCTRNFVHPECTNTQPIDRRFDRAVVQQPRAFLLRIQRMYTFPQLMNIQ
jgi:hypothetical protein